MFSIEFLEQLPRDPLTRINQLCEKLAPDVVQAKRLWLARNAVLLVLTSLSAFLVIRIGIAFSGSIYSLFTEARGIGALLALTAFCIPFFFVIREFKGHLERIYKDIILDLDTIRLYVKNCSETVDLFLVKTNLFVMVDSDLDLKHRQSAKNKLMYDISTDMRTVCAAINEIDYNRIRRKNQEEIQARLDAEEPYEYMPQAPYELTDAELQRVQDLIQELKTSIRNSGELTESHKDRLLSRLDALQQRVNKKMSSLDKVFALIGTAGITLGKLGPEVKPLVDSFRELADVFRAVGARGDSGRDANTLLTGPDSDPVPLMPQDEPAKI